MAPVCQGQNRFRVGGWFQAYWVQMSSKSSGPCQAGDYSCLGDSHSVRIYRSCAAPDDLTIVGRQLSLVLFPVMAVPGCQLDCFYNQLKPNQLGTPMRDPLHSNIWDGKTHPKSGPHLLVAAKVKGCGRRKPLLLPACFRSCWQVLLSCC